MRKYIDGVVGAPIQGFIAELEYWEKVDAERKQKKRWEKEQRQRQEEQQYPKLSY